MELKDERGHGVQAGGEFRGYSRCSSSLKLDFFCFFARKTPCSQHRTRNNGNATPDIATFDCSMAENEGLKAEVRPVFILLAMLFDKA